jgi:hypothetical protein
MRPGAVRVGGRAERDDDTTAVDLVSFAVTQPSSRDVEDGESTVIRVGMATLAPEEVAEVVKDDTLCCGMSLQCLVLAGIVGFVAIAAIVAGVIVSVLSDDSSDPAITSAPSVSSSADSSSTSSSPSKLVTTSTPYATFAPTLFSSRFEALLQRIGPTIVASSSDQEQLRDTATTQH